MEANQTNANQTRPPRTLRLVLKWLALTFLLVAVMGAVAMYLAYRAASGVPDWYHPPATQQATTSADARLAEKKIAGVQNWAAAKHAYESAKKHGEPLAKRPADELVISFTQGEVNSFLAKWYGRFGRDSVNGRRLSDIFQGPMVRLEPERITFAGAVPPLGGRVVSLDVRPVVKDGKLHLEVLTVRSGNLPLPEFTWSKPRQMLIEAFSGIMMKLAPQARIDSAGAANMEAVSAVMAQQGADTLQNRATQNVLFLPVLSEKAGLPVRLKSCELSDGAITLTTEPLEKAQRDAVLYQLRGGTEPEKLPSYLTETPATRRTPTTRTAE